MANSKHHPSVSSNQSKIIDSIQKLHLNGNPFELDPAFNKGSMYGNLSTPSIKFDIVPLSPECIQADYTKMPLANDSIDSICVDPPFIIGTTGTMVNEYSGFNTLDQMHLNLIGLLSECTRCIKRDGILAIKCQDLIHDRRRYFTSYFIQNILYDLGWNQIDEFIVTARSRMHAAVHTGKNYSRSYHCKFMVFRFRRGRRNYSLIRHSDSNSNTGSRYSDSITYNGPGLE
jgi:hypothetical protein